MLKRLKALFIKQAKNSDGNSLPDFTQKITECYADTDAENRWQGDIYLKENFSQASLPTPNVPYWMLVNRTCHLHLGKLPYLNFIAVYPLPEYIKNLNSKQSIKNIISNLVKDDVEGVQFLPARPESGLDYHLVANFNLVYTFGIKNTAGASNKLMQLSSPFSEHVFQRFSRYFYTVGYDDHSLRDKEFIATIVEECEEQLKQ